MPILIFLLATVHAYGQVVEFPDVVPSYEKPPKEQAKEARKFAALLAKSECMEEGNTPVTFLKAILIISKNGKVIDAEFPDLVISAECKYALRKEFLALNGFKPGKVKGENVIAKYTYSISCIKWAEE